MQELPGMTSRTTNNTYCDQFGPRGASRESLVFLVLESGIEIVFILTVRRVVRGSGPRRVRSRFSRFIPGIIVFFGSVASTWFKW